MDTTVLSIVPSLVIPTSTTLRVGKDTKVKYSALIYKTFNRGHRITLVPIIMGFITIGKRGIIMSKFEQVGINYQYDADSKEKANNAFKHSCNVCCHKGIQLDCEKCAIAHVHNLVVAYFDERKTEKGA